MEKVRILTCICQRLFMFKRPSVLYYGKALVVRPCVCERVVTTIWYEEGANAQAAA